LFAGMPAKIGQHTMLKLIYYLAFANVLDSFTGLVRFSKASVMNEKCNCLYDLFTTLTGLTFFQSLRNLVKPFKRLSMLNLKPRVPSLLDMKEYITYFLSFKVITRFAKIFAFVFFIIFSFMLKIKICLLTYSLNFQEYL
tara:strand:+ start:702 stop:1121 length:420 start_codon:yes stop_codon:yes gene_type:complete